MRNLVKALFVSLGILCMSVATAADDSALTMLKDVTTQMTSTLTAEQAAIKKDPNEIVKIVDKIILPHIDIEDMARGVLARHWRAATPQQRLDFQNAFETWAVLSYSAAFLHYTNQQIEFGKVLPIGNKGDREQINTLIKQASGPSIAVNYRMVNKNGAWKVYDINVENVSLVNSFRSQVSSQISQKGLDAVTADINKRNAKGLTVK
ncbi:MAG: phospholipid-binding protein MlaC [Gammaproteobacteria bacterium]